MICKQGRINHRCVNSYLRRYLRKTKDSIIILQEVNSAERFATIKEQKKSFTTLSRKGQSVGGDFFTTGNKNMH
jgi:hypothetical protein